MVLAALETLGLSLDDFKVDGRHIKDVTIQTRAETSSAPAEFERTGRRRLERAHLMAKLDAVFGYFEFAANQAPPEKVPSGFRIPREG